MIYLKKFEDIKIPIKVGDTILGGRFKNKKTIVKKIGKNDKGDITINGKPLLKYRLLKESLESFKEESDDLLRSIFDIGLHASYEIYDESGNIIRYESKNIKSYSVRIYKQLAEEHYHFDSPGFEWIEIQPDIQAYISQMTEEFGFDIKSIYTISVNNSGYKRDIHSKDDILNDINLGMIKCIRIEFTKS